MARTKVAVCVCSGGIDSTVAATIATHEGYEVHFFHASYGQRAEEREKETVEKIARYLGAKERKLVEIPFLKELGGSALTDVKRKVPVAEEVDLDKEQETPSTWVPCRNLILLAHASAYAEVIGAEAIFVGFNAEEARSYPDNDVDFVKRYNAVLEKAVASFSRVPSVKAPLVNLLKPEIIKKGMEVKAPLHLTYSCYLGGAKHCGICASCLHRRRGFKDAGVEDPTEYIR
ncbi:MAG TPA: 7-cyano-7-deazaguanine synthase QueC [Candidatus Bathyarchaeia archaeon]|nr:7-cyano-7-deazaguanine synthase QueC [Candidatus Bathyarchaeia archaeon]